MRSPLKLGLLALVLTFASILAHAKPYLKLETELVARNDFTPAVTSNSLIAKADLDNGSASIPSTLEARERAPPKTKSFQIILHQKVTYQASGRTLKPFYENLWAFFEGEYGIPINPCAAEPLREQFIGNDHTIVNYPPWPLGEWDMELFGTGCFYAANGQNAGALRCPGHPTIICEEEHNRRGGIRDTFTCGNHRYHRTAFCNL